MTMTTRITRQRAAKAAGGTTNNTTQVKQEAVEKVNEKLAAKPKDKAGAPAKFGAGTKVQARRGFGSVYHDAEVVHCQEMTIAPNCKSWFYNVEYSDDHHVEKDMHGHYLRKPNEPFRLGEAVQVRWRSTSTYHPATIAGVYRYPLLTVLSNRRTADMSVSLTAKDVAAKEKATTVEVLEGDGNDNNNKGQATTDSHSEPPQAKRRKTKETMNDNNNDSNGNNNKNNDSSNGKNDSRNGNNDSSNGNNDSGNGIDDSNNNENNDNGKESNTGTSTSQPPSDPSSDVTDPQQQLQRQYTYFYDIVYNDKSRKELHPEYRKESRFIRPFCNNIYSVGEKVRFFKMSAKRTLFAALVKEVDLPKGKRKLAACDVHIPSENKVERIRTPSMLPDDPTPDFQPQQVYEVGDRVDVRYRGGIMLYEGHVVAVQQGEHTKEATVPSASSDKDAVVVAAVAMTTPDKTDKRETTKRTLRNSAPLPTTPVPSPPPPPTTTPPPTPSCTYTIRYHDDTIERNVPHHYLKPCIDGNFAVNDVVAARYNGQAIYCIGIVVQVRGSRYPEAKSFDIQFKDGPLAEDVPCYWIRPMINDKNKDSQQQKGEMVEEQQGSQQEMEPTNDQKIDNGIDTEEKKTEKSGKGDLGKSGVDGDGTPVTEIIAVVQADINKSGSEDENGEDNGEVGETVKVVVDDDDIIVLN